MIGIYNIINTVNNKRYIGSSNNLERRHYRHFYDLRNGSHANKHLQSAVTKYGLDNFIFKTIELCEIENLLIIEQEHIDSYDKSELYNLTFITTGGGSYVQRLPTYLLDLDGNIVKEFESIVTLANSLNCSISSHKSVNNGSTFKRKYRVVTKKFYEHNLDEILSWKNYTSETKEKARLYNQRQCLSFTLDDKDYDIKGRSNVASILGLSRQRVDQLLQIADNKYNLRFKF